MPKGLGRIVVPDDRDRAFPMKAALELAVPPRPARKTWRIWWKGDQGDTPMCVGYSWHGFLRSLPLLQRDPSALWIYKRAQQIDEWPGEEYEGSSVRAGVKALQEKGLIKNYVWAYNVDTIVEWLARNGPVVLGTTWYEDMFTPDRNGVVVPGGRIAGGHAYEAIGYDDPTEMIICQNSWGDPWGLNGRFKISYDDLNELLKDQGEACAATEQAVQSIAA